MAKMGLLGAHPSQIDTCGHWSERLRHAVCLTLHVFRHAHLNTHCLLLFKPLTREASDGSPVRVIAVAPSSSQPKRHHLAQHEPCSGPYHGTTPSPTALQHQLNQAIECTSIDHSNNRPTLFSCIPHPTQQRTIDCTLHPTPFLRRI
jgi:hypothetical protein